MLNILIGLYNLLIKPKSDTIGNINQF